jgi:hypothetical protein
LIEQRLEGVSGEVVKVRAHMPAFFNIIAEVSPINSLAILICCETLFR